MNPSYGIILWIVVGALAGWVGSMIMGTNAKQGAIMNIVVGIIGAFIGDWLLPQLHIALGSGILSSILNATIGAIVLLVIIKLVRGGGRSWRRR